MPYNLFIEHHEKIQPRKIRSSYRNGAIGTGWEDDFTNILSFYLNSDHNALKKYKRNGGADGETTHDRVLTENGHAIFLKNTTSNI